MNFDEVLENFIGLVFAGTDTTGNFTGMCFYMLGKHQEVQKQIYNEILKYYSEKRPGFEPKKDL